MGFRVFGRNRRLGILLGLLGGQGIAYILRDLFTTTLAAGAVNGTAAEPGPGTRTVVDTENKLSIAGGKVIFAGGRASPGYGDPSLWNSTLVTRKAGVAFYWRWHLTTITGKIAAGGFGPVLGAVVQPIGYTLASTSGTLIYDGTSNPTVDAGVANDSIDERCLVLRSTGVFFFGRVAGHWLLQWIMSTGTNDYYSVIGSYNATFEADDMLACDVSWLPTPIISQSFNAAFSPSDGNGHAGQSPLEAGGSGVVISQNVGTWGVAAGLGSASALDGGLALATAPVGVANHWVRAGLVRSAGNVGVILRWTDVNNYVRVYHDGTSVIIEEIVAGTPSTLATTAAAYGAGVVLMAFAHNSSVRAFYGVAARGSVTINAALTGTTVGLYTTNTGNTFDNFLAYARGSEDQYFRLNALRTGDENNLFTIGDSKTNTQTWVASLVTALNINATPMHREITPRPAFSGATVATMAGAIDGYIAGKTGTIGICTINLGANDVSSLPAEATWKANLTYIINAVRADSTSAHIYITRVQRQGKETECNTLAGWIADVVALDTSGYVHVGMDERTWLSDNAYADFSSDGVHYNAAGQTKAAAEELAVLT